MEHKVKRLKTSTSIFRVKSSVPYIRFFCTSTSTTTMYLWQIVEIFYYLPEVHSSSSSRSTKNIRNFLYFYYYYYHVPLVVSRNFLLSTRGKWQQQWKKYKRTLCNEPSYILNTFLPYTLIHISSHDVPKLVDEPDYENKTTYLAIKSKHSVVSPCYSAVQFGQME